MLESELNLAMWSFLASLQCGLGCSPLAVQLLFSTDILFFLVEIVSILSSIFFFTISRAFFSNLWRMCTGCSYCLTTLCFGTGALEGCLEKEVKGVGLFFLIWPHLNGLSWHWTAYCPSFDLVWVAHSLSWIVKAWPGRAGGRTAALGWWFLATMIDPCTTLLK